MAIKKSDLHSSFWASCNELRGGMDASQYKDCAFFMLFIQPPIFAEKSGLFEVLAYVAHLLPPFARECHAKVHINSQFNAKQQAFLDSCYRITVADPGGKPDEITKVFARFQKCIYASAV